LQARGGRGKERVSLKSSDWKAPGEISRAKNFMEGKRELGNRGGRVHARMFGNVKA